MQVSNHSGYPRSFRRSILSWGGPFPRSFDVPQSPHPPPQKIRTSSSELTASPSAMSRHVIMLLLRRKDTHPHSTLTVLRKPRVSGLIILFLN